MESDSAPRPRGRPRKYPAPEPAPKPERESKLVLSRTFAEAPDCLRIPEAAHLIGMSPTEFGYMLKDPSLGIPQWRRGKFIRIPKEAFRTWFDKASSPELKP